MAKSLKEVRIELSRAMIVMYIESIGLDIVETYEEDRNFWQWKHGSAIVQVFVQSVALGNDETREYLRIFSYLGDIPAIRDRKSVV